jgi:hypothetical protein
MTFLRYVNLLNVLRGAATILLALGFGLLALYLGM